MSRRGVTLLVTGALIVALFILAAVLPVPYVVLVPGPVTDTLGNVENSSTPVVSVSGAKTYTDSGHLYLTTVGVLPGDCSAHPTLVQAVRAWFDRDEAVQPHQVICPPGESSSSVAAQNAADMSQSQRDAVTAALRELGYKPSSEQVVVDAIDASAPAAGQLRRGDVIVAVDGTTVKDTATLRSLVSRRRAGDVLDLTIQRAGTTRSLQVATTSDQGRTVIGISPGLVEHFPVSVKIGIDPQQVGGPSAGMAFALGIIDKLTPGGLTGGRVIAGTGTIDPTGKVGPIGGIQQKIAAAVHHKASVFLAPASECASAKPVAPKSLTLVKVDTLHTAVSALKAIASGSNDFPHC